MVGANLKAKKNFCSALLHTFPIQMHLEKSIGIIFMVYNQLRPNPWLFLVAAVNGLKTAIKHIVL